MIRYGERTIFVTGATGTVGSEVVKQLASSGQRGQSVIRAAVHSQNRADKFKSDNKTVEIVNIDYNKPETIADTLDHVDTLFLVTLPAPNMANISSSLVEEAKKNGVKYIVKLSVMKADAEPGTIMGRLHREEEKSCVALPDIERPNSLYSSTSGLIMVHRSFRGYFNR